MKIPKKTKYKKYHKLNQKLTQIAARKTKLSFGYWGLKAIEGGRVSEKQIEAVRQSIMKKIRPAGQLWIRIFPDIPVTSKPVGVRMGKGKGSVEKWVAVVSPGEVLYEIGGVSSLKAKMALKLGSKKLPIRTKIVNY